MPKVWMETRRN